MTFASSLTCSFSALGVSCRRKGKKRLLKALNVQFFKVLFRTNELLASSTSTNIAETRKVGISIKQKTELKVQNQFTHTLKQSIIPIKLTTS